MIKVLAVDDSTVIHTVYRQHFRRVPGVSLELVRDGRAALAHIEAHGPPALVLMDINMPELDGLECLRRMAEGGLLAHTRVVMVSTESTETDVARARALGAVEYVKKPFTPERLREVVQRHLSPGGV